ncbi:MAG: hypothetical protein JJT82_04575 [Legionellaceae bacterium]|nr:hypothetical protein [Legionellaceae bacterium]
MPKSLADSLQLQELLESERRYAASLELLKDTLSHAQGHYSSQLLPIITELRQTAVDIIENLQQTLALLERDSNDSNQPEDASLRLKLGIQRVMLVRDFFAQLTHYSPLFTEITNAQKESPELFTQLNAHIIKTDKMGIDSLLMQPIQRGPRYQLLLKEILKFMQDHPESADKRQMEMVTGILETVQEKLQDVNAQTPDSKAVNKPYQFGDYTRKLLGISHHCPEIFLLPSDKEPDEKSATAATSGKTYQFGDLTRYFLWRASSQNQDVGDQDKKPSSSYQ